LAGHGTPSEGPVSRHHWAFHDAGTTFKYDPQSAAKVLAAAPKGTEKRLTIKCLTLSTPPFEQLALIAKQQLAAVGVDLVVQEETSADGAIKAVSEGQYEALLIEVASGWNLSRPYRWWHSKGPQNALKYSNPKVDAGLDRISHAANDDEYR